MRIWTLHPKYLDTKGLLALWREGLLAQKVLAGATRGYRNHPQLKRFQAEPEPVAALAAYLCAVVDEARARGYRFDESKIAPNRAGRILEETDGQLGYEWGHLRAKLALRDPVRLRSLDGIVLPDPHPLFRVVPGAIRDWERV